jgi:hypothetical protein
MPRRRGWNATFKNFAIRTRGSSGRTGNCVNDRGRTLPLCQRTSNDSNVMRYVPGFGHYLNFELTSRLPLSYQPCFALPLEVIVIIAGFLAGSNNYGTLASLCVCSQLVQQECQATLYETVICNDYWNEEFKRCSAPPSLVPKTWKYIRYGHLSDGPSDCPIC